MERQVAAVAVAGDARLDGVEVGEGDICVDGDDVHPGHVGDDGAVVELGYVSVMQLDCIGRGWMGGHANIEGSFGGSAATDED